MTLPNHLTLRRGTYQYVRRIPSDLAADFPYTRIQKSLGTIDKRAARQAALDLDAHWERRFAEIRAGKGLTLVDARPITLITEDWTWPDWEGLASWFGACLAEEDWRARLGAARGAVLKKETDLGKLPWRNPEVVREHIARRSRLEDCSVAEYAVSRLAFVQSYVRRLGINLTSSHPEHERFMASCLGAELAYLDTFQLREARRGGLDSPHPDSIAGPWRRVTQAVRPDAALRADSTSDVANALVGKTLSDCRAKWTEARERLKKPARPDYLRDMEITIADFERHSGVRDVGAIRRKHVLAYRDHLVSTTGLAAQTVNKKIGFVSSLMAVALNSGWVETPLGPNIFVPVPEDEDVREPYSEPDLRKIFAHPVFTAGYRFTQVKAGGELQFWLPLIACLHGMISSEILQLGPDSVGAHPDHPDIVCLTVTNAGERRVKTLARRRRIPVRKELLDLGLLDIAKKAERDGRDRLWKGCSSSIEMAKTSRYFSTFWSDFTRREVGITSNDASLYSLRHVFQDRLAAAGFGEDVKKSLMGHADSGMTARYGTKRQPRVVDMIRLDEAIQRLKWPFLVDVRRSR